MPYVVRDESGKIQRVSTRSLLGAEILPHGHAEVVDFLLSHRQSPQDVEEALDELQRTDAEMARATEDIITVLLRKNIMKMTDLPREVQERIARRVKLRIQIEETYEKASRDAMPVTLSAAG